MFLFFYVPRWRFRAGLLLTVFSLILGMMPLWPQSSGSNLNGSQHTLQNWNALYSEGLRIYERQENALTALNQRISSLERGSNEWMNLSEKLSESNRNLKEYNEQIAERMQERDEDLAWAYAELDAKDITIAEKETVIWKLIAVIVIMGVFILGILTFAIIKIIFWIKGGAAASLIKKLFVKVF